MLSFLWFCALLVFWDLNFSFWGIFSLFWAGPPREETHQRKLGQIGKVGANLFSRMLVVIYQISKVSQQKLSLSAPTTPKLHILVNHAHLRETTFFHNMQALHLWVHEDWTSAMQNFIHSKGKWMIPCLPVHLTTLLAAWIPPSG